MIFPENLSPYAEQFWPLDGSGLAGAVVRSEPDAITVVTAFFDIGRASWSQKFTDTSKKFERSVDKYFENFGRLAFLKNEMVIFISPELAARALKLRQDAGLADRTIIFTIDNIFECPGVRELRAAISHQMTRQFRDFVWRPFVPEVNEPDYVIVNALKPAFACTAIDKGVVRAHQLAWIDFGYTHSDNLFDPEIEWRYSCGNKINLFNIYKLDELPIYNVVRGGEVYFAGCHIVGPTIAWPKFNHQMSDALVSLLDCNMVDDDQTLMLMAWRRNPESFILRRYPTETELGWRYVFKRFCAGAESDAGQLPKVQTNSQQSWIRDLKALIRRKLRRWHRRRFSSRA